MDEHQDLLSRSTTRGVSGGWNRHSRSISPVHSRLPHSRSRSPRRRRSRSDSRNGFGDRRSHSPMSSRRRHVGNRDDPAPSNCIGVFGLSVYTTERQLEDIFDKYGDINKVQVVLDSKTGKSRGFGFVYFTSAKSASKAKDDCSGMEIDGRRIRVDFSITSRAHTPTPGVYMGKPSTGSDRRSNYDRGYDNRSSGYRDRYRSRSPRYRSPSPRYRSPSPRYRQRSGPSSSRRDYYDRGYDRDYNRSRDRGYDGYDKYSRYEKFDRADRYDRSRSRSFSPSRYIRY